MKTILAHSNLIDCVEPEVRPDTAVLIVDGRIRAILPSGEVGNAGDAQVIDLKGGYLRRASARACIARECPSRSQPLRGLGPPPPRVGVPLLGLRLTPLDDLVSVQRPQCSRAPSGWTLCPGRSDDNASSS